jgi:hypothetical protein
MTNPVIANSDRLRLEIFNPKYQDAILKFAGIATWPLGTIMARLAAIAGAITPDAGNTGDGTVTNFALAPGGPPLPGSWNLECTAAYTAPAAVADVGNTGDGTVSGLSLNPGGPVLPGAWNFECTAAYVAPVAGTPAFTGTGNGTASNEAAGSATENGTYTLTCIDATVSGSEIFEVKTPDGVTLEPLTVGVSYSNNHLVLDITDGSTDFIVGDFWTIAMTVGAVPLHGGVFKLEDPNSAIVLNNVKLPGITAGTTVLVDYNGLRFTLTDGATDFIVGDKFAITVAAGAVPLHGGVFKLEDPNSVIVKSGIALPGSLGGTVLVEEGGLTCLITDGSTDFVVGDKFALAITDGALKWQPYVEDALDGTGEAKGVMPEAKTSTGAGDVRWRMLIGGEVAESKLSVLAGGTIPPKALEDLRNFTILSTAGVNLSILDNQ